MESICQYGGYGMIKPKPMAWILLGTIFMWYFLILYPITTILTIISSSIFCGLILKYTDERNRNV